MTSRNPYRSRLCMASRPLALASVGAGTLALVLGAGALAPLVADAVAPAFAYESIPIDDAGSISGRVVCAVDGRSISYVPEDDDAEACGETVEIATIEVDGNGGLRHAVVFVESIDAGIAIDKTVHHELRIEECVFEPLVLSISAGQVLDIVNRDDILHSVRAVSDGAEIFATHLPMKGMKIDKRLFAPGLVRVSGDTDRPWMRAWLLVHDHPYHAVTDAKGRFALRRLPKGTYRLTAWHAELGTQTIEVEIDEGKTAEVLFDSLSVSEAASDTAGVDRRFAADGDSARGGGVEEEE